MAKVISHLHSVMRRHIAGVTYSTLPSGTIVARQYVTPSPSHSKAQMEVRNAIKLLTSIWMAATEEQRKIYGNPPPPDAVSKFIHYGFLHALVWGRGLIPNEPDWFDHDPAKFAIPGTLSILAPTTGNGFGIGADNTLGSTGLMLLVDRAEPVSDATYRFHGSWLTDTYKYVTVPTEGTDSVEFTDLETSKRYPVRIRTASLIPNCAVFTSETILIEEAVAHV